MSIKVGRFYCLEKSCNYVKLFLFGHFYSNYCVNIYPNRFGKQ